MIERTPRSTFYDGALYGHLVDPLLRGVHGFVASHLPPGNRVLDACCGTGSLARAMAAEGRRVHGVDLSPRNIDYARSHTASDSVTYALGDVSQLEPPEEGPFDLATVVLAIHEMPAEARAPVLSALLRAAVRVMAVDFAAPMPWNLSGARNRAMEAAAGRVHLGAYRDYQRRGGLPAVIAETGAEVESQRKIDRGTLVVATLRGAA